MGNPYGKTALSANWTMPNFDAYLVKIQASGKNIDEACIDAVNKSLPPIRDKMVAGAERHERNGDVVNAIEITPAKKEGNLIYGVVGIDWGKHPEAKHGVYQEYGDGHSVGFPDPFVRPAFDENKSEVLKIQRQTLKAHGVPIDGGTEGSSSASGLPSGSVSHSQMVSFLKDKSLDQIHALNDKRVDKFMREHGKGGLY